MADKFFVKTGVFYKKKPLRPAAGAQLGKKLIRPPEEFLSKPYGMRKHCFPLLPANCRQAGFLNWANDVNPHGGVIDLAGSVVFIFGPSSIKVYYTNRQVQIEGAAFYRRPIKLILDNRYWMLDARWRLFALLDSLFHLPADEMRSAAEKIDSDYKQNQPVQNLFDS